jgi:hypothetical protein
MSFPSLLRTFNYDELDRAARALEILRGRLILSGTKAGIRLFVAVELDHDIFTALRAEHGIGFPAFDDEATAERRKRRGVALAILRENLAIGNIEPRQPITLRHRFRPSSPLARSR